MVAIVILFSYHIELLATKSQTLWNVKLLVNYVVRRAVDPQK